MNNHRAQWECDWIASHPGHFDSSEQAIAVCQNITKRLSLTSSPAIKALKSEEIPLTQTEIDSAKYVVNKMFMHPETGARHMSAVIHCQNPTDRDDDDIGLEYREYARDEHTKLMRSAKASAIYPKELSLKSIADLINDPLHKEFLETVFDEFGTSERTSVVALVSKHGGVLTVFYYSDACQDRYSVVINFYLK